MNENISRFNAQAGLWDDNPVRAALSRSIVALAARELAAFPAPPRLMDYGCGTGMCSLPLAASCGSLLAVDVSPGMLEKLREKAAANGLGNVCTLCHDLSLERFPLSSLQIWGGAGTPASFGAWPVSTDTGTAPQMPREHPRRSQIFVKTFMENALAPLPGEASFDVILSAMALHHVRDVPGLIRRFRPLLAPGGVLLLADLDAEDGSFHYDATGVEHQGFQREWLLNQLWEAGFREVHLKTAHVVEKPVKTGGTGKFPVFFVSARN